MKSPHTPSTIPRSSLAFKRELRARRWGAHRGDEAAFPENTLEAFQSAARQGARCIETDLRMTVDDEIVLHHDPTVRGRLIEKCSAKSLRGLGLPSPSILFAPPFDRILIGFEVKTPTRDFDPERIARAVARSLSKRRGPYFFLSFSREILDALGRILPRVPRVLNVSSSDPGTRRRSFRDETLRFMADGRFQGLCLSRKLLRTWNVPDNVPLLCYTLRNGRAVRHFLSTYSVDLAFLSRPADAAAIPARRRS